MAGAIQLTEVDFQQIKDNLIDYLKSTKQFTDYDFNGSNLQVILNLIAYQAQLNAYSTNMIANESFLASASLRNNVVSNARMVGYVPISARSAKSLIAFDFQLSGDNYPSGFPQYIQINPGMCLSTGTGTDNYIFNVIDTHVAAVASTGLCRFENIPVYEGVRLTTQFVVDESDYNQRFILENANIDTTTLRVEIQEDPNENVNTFFREANNIVQLDETSAAYWVEEIDDLKYELTFGDGLFGRKLQNGAIINISFLVTNGPLANGIQGVTKLNFVAKPVDTAGSALTELPTLTSFSIAEGGTLLEGVGSVKFRAPKFYASQDRCVVGEDYESIIKQIYPAIDDVYVYGGEELTIPEYGRVYIVVKPSATDALSSTAKNFIKKSLEDYRIASIDVVLQDPAVIDIEVITTVYYDDKRTNKDSSAIVASVRETLTNYAGTSTVSKFGGAVRYSRIVGAIDDSDPSITRNNTELRMRREFLALTNTAASYEVCFENPYKILDTGGSVYSTGFTMLQSNNVDDGRTYYFEDDGKGNLYLFYFDINFNKIITDKEFGTVDYTKGEAMIGFQNPLTITGTVVPGNLVEIRAMPVNLDIVAKQSVYIQMDVANSDINAIVDTEISGS